MNEVSNFCNGECKWTDTCNGTYSILPYTPGNVSLNTETIRMDAIHYGNLAEYNVHNFFGFLEAKATYEYLLTLSNLTFILTRSSAPGSGKFAAHWLGDNGATWEFMRLSISGCMDFSLFGIPMVGADICGFMGQTTPELCSRWMQLGTLYTFSRNHHQNDNSFQEPYNLGPTTLETSRIALQLRYSLLKYFYSLFVIKNSIGTIFRPVFFEFPTDQAFFNLSLNYTDEQFMIGSYLMVSPVLYEGNNWTMTYFPEARWYDFFSGIILQDVNNTSQVINISAPLNSTIPLFLRAGTIIHTQNVTGVLSTSQLNNQFNLIVALEPIDQSGDMSALGYIMSLSNYSDENIVLKCQLRNCLLEILANSSASENSVTILLMIDAVDPTNDLEPIIINAIYLFGLNITQFTTISVYINDDYISNASAGQIDQGNFPVIYLPNITISYGDTIMIKNY